jgi:hypothetical protein
MIYKKAAALLLEYGGHNPVSFLQRQLGVSWNRAAEIYEALNDNKEALLNAAKYLRRFQDWRTGKDVRTQKDAGINPSALTEAINTILEYFGLPEPLTNCEGCKYNVEAAGCITLCNRGNLGCKFEPKENEGKEE